jgi:hypothetical protein
MARDANGIGDDPPALIEPHLGPAEKLVWVGRPSPDRFRWGAWSETALGIYGAAIGLAVTGGFAYGLSKEKGWVLAPSLLALPAGLWVSYASVKTGVMAVPRYRRALAAAVYAVTSERAVVVNGFGCASGCRLVALDNPDRSFRGATVQGREVKRRRRDGSGDIVFDSTLKRGRRGHLRVELGFFGVGDVDRVNNLLGAIPRGPMKFDLDSPPD